MFTFIPQFIGELHIFYTRATERMRNYKPGEHSDTVNVAPLVQFFELVHIGDTIQSITQVYFDKELVRYFPTSEKSLVLMSYIH